MEKSFNEYYLLESAKEYKYKLKFAAQEVTEEQKDKLESALQKYDLRSVATYKETPIQESPLDFPNVRNTKVFVTEIVLGYPVTTDMLRRYIADKACMNEQNVAVYSANDPREVYTTEWLERQSADYKESYKPYLGSDPEETEVPPYGDEHNKNLLAELEAERKERKIHNVENPLMPKQKTDSTPAAKKPESEKSFSILGNKERKDRK